MLIALLLPALSQAREMAKQMNCLSNLRTLGLAMNMYAMDHDGVVASGPWTGHWARQLQGYGSTSTALTSNNLSEGVWDCPAQDRPLTQPDYWPVTDIAFGESPNGPYHVNNRDIDGWEHPSRKIWLYGRGYPHPAEHAGAGYLDSHAAIVDRINLNKGVFQVWPHLP
ncbi:hypothetical protein [Natronomicrosphaera hydrolytica]|uniref:hypothetical protein n=1 Tax=Natronomicrosphaera hydrolytica TaxID=3242702 RepID=UPI003CC916DE